METPQSLSIAETGLRPDEVLTVPNWFCGFGKLACDFHASPAVVKEYSAYHDSALTGRGVTITSVCFVFKNSHS